MIDRQYTIEFKCREGRGGVIEIESNRVACAVAVVVTHRRRVLVGKRPGESQDFEWQLPGGWIQLGETPQQAARREVTEETRLILRDLHFVGISNNIFSTHNHSISLYFEAECVDGGALAVVESDRCIAWEWKNWAGLSGNLFLPLRLLKQTDYRPFLTDKRRTYVSS